MKIWQKLHFSILKLHTAVYPKLINGTALLAKDFLKFKKLKDSITQPIKLKDSAAITPKL